MATPLLLPLLLKLAPLLGRTKRLIISGLAAAWLLHIQALAWDSERMATAASRLGARAQASLPALRAVLAQGRALDEIGRLRLVNRFFNERIQFRSDLEVWGQEDFWTTPLQTLQAGAGDCEDYAIAKYFSLQAMGIPAAKLRLVYVRAQLDARTVQAHMVLAFYANTDAEPQILDNLAPDIRPAHQRTDLTPVFSFNSEGLWQGVGAVHAGDPTTRLSRWRDVLVRAAAEGF